MIKTPRFILVFMLIGLLLSSQAGAENQNAKLSDNDIYRPLEPRMPVTPRSIFAKGVQAYDPGWQVPADSSRGREDFEFAISGRPDIPGFNSNDHFNGLIKPFLSLSVAQTVNSTAEDQILGTTMTPSGYGNIEELDNGVLIDMRQEVSDPVTGKWWIHHVAIKSSLLSGHKLTARARNPETFKAIIDTLFFSYENFHWLEIREAKISEFPDRIEYCVRGVSYRGHYSYYKKEGGMGMVKSANYRIDFRFTLDKSTGAVKLKPGIVDEEGVHHEPAPLIDMSGGKLLK